MKQLKIIGVCVAAMYVFSVIGTTAAQAGEYGYCAKAAKIGKVYKGLWLNSACEPASAMASRKEVESGGTKNAYEWVSVVGMKLTTKNKTSTLESADGTITCKSSEVEEEITGWQTDTDSELFRECILGSTGGKCTGGELFNEKHELVPAPEGDIATFPLKTYLLDHGTIGRGGREPLEDEAWTEFFAEPGNPTGTGEHNRGDPLQAAFVCSPEVRIETSGTLSGNTTPVSKPGKKFATSFGPGEEEQDLIATVFDPYEVNAVPITVTVRGHGKLEGLPEKTEKKIELRECNEVGAVSENKGALTCEHEEEQPSTL